MKTKKLKNILGLGILFIASAGFLFFGNAENANADGICMYRPKDGGWFTQVARDPVKDSVACIALCKEKGIQESGEGATSSDCMYQDNSTKEITTVASNDQTECSWWTNPINCPLVDILQLEGHLLGMSGTLFTVINKVDNFKAVVDGKAVYSAWKTVRDFLNIAFILVLLYSAFCTILQIEKYSYKKLLLTLVIMALLVNFSFPITRFIIDVSNTLMYTIINGLQYGTKATDSVDTAFGLLSNNSGIATILKSDVNSQTSFLLAAVIFVFIFAITLLAIGVMFLIRMIALAILIIFSPLAFVATILPDASGYSSKWWDNLFKYAFFGPIMMFMIYVATQMMAEMSPGLQAKFVTAAQSQSTVPNLVGTMAYFSIPIVILWLGMGVAQSMSIAGAATVMGGAQKVAKWAGKKFSGYNAIKKQYDAFASQRKKREEEKAKGRLGGKIGKWANRTQDSVIGAIPVIGSAAKKRVTKMRDEERRKDMDDKSKEKEDTKTTVEMANEINAVFNATGTIDPTTKVTDDQAGSAKAYTKKNSDEKKDFVADELAGKTTIPVTSALKNILGGTLPPRVQAALTAVLTSLTPTEGDLRTVAAFVGKQSEEVMKTYVKQ